MFAVDMSARRKRPEQFHFALSTHFISQFLMSFHDSMMFSLDFNSEEMDFASAGVPAARILSAKSVRLECVHFRH